MPDHRVSVVVISRDRSPELRRTLRHLSALPERPRTVVLDNGSSDGTVRALRSEFPEVSWLPLPVNHGAVARNLGVTACTTPYVAFCDDDTWWDPGCLSHAADEMDRDPALAVINARILVEPGGQEDPICTELAASPLPVRTTIRAPALLSFLAGASVVRKRAFQSVGGFSRLIFIGGEEELLGSDLLEAGWAMAYLAELVIHHHASQQRDPGARRRLGVRNTLRYTWMRRPVADAVRRTAAQLRRLPADRVSAGGCLDAVAGAPAVVRARVPLSADVAAQIRQLDPIQLASTARRYVS